MISPKESGEAEKDDCDDLPSGWASEIFVDAMFEDPNDNGNTEERSQNNAP